MGKTFFLVAGFPRSRTAWLANLLTQHDSICFHDPFAFNADPAEVLEKIRNAPYGNVGVADPAILTIPDLYIASFPKAKVLLVHRDREQCAQSWFKSHGKPMGFTLEAARRKIGQMAQAVECIRSHYPETLAVDYDELSNLETLHRIHYFCCPLDQISDTRVKILTGLNVVQNLI